MSMIIINHHHLSTISYSDRVTFLIQIGIPNLQGLSKQIL